MNLVWNRFVETSYKAKVIPAQKYGSKWIPPAYESIDPLKDADPDLKRIRSGTLTLPEAIAQQGYDVEQQLNEIEATNKVLDTKGMGASGASESDLNIRYFFHLVGIYFGFVASEI